LHRTDLEAPGGGSGNIKKSRGGDKGHTISLKAVVHLGHMLWALMTKKKKKTAIFRAMSQVESVGGERRMIEIKSPFKFRA